MMPFWCPMPLLDIYSRIVIFSPKCDYNIIYSKIVMTNYYYGRRDKSTLLILLALVSQLNINCLELFQTSPLLSGAPYNLQHSAYYPAILYLRFNE